MFQRQARRLETQLYQRAQDLRTIEVTQRQAALARTQVQQLEQHHLEQAARISQSAKSLQRLQELIRESVLASHAALGKCEMLEHDAFELRKVAAEKAPEALATLRLRSSDCPEVAAIRRRVAALEAALLETEQAAVQQIGVTPLQSAVMTGDCNPLNDLSAVADYACKADVSPRATEPSCMAISSRLPGNQPISAAVSPSASSPSINYGSTATSSGLSPALGSGCCNSGGQLSSAIAHAHSFQGVTHHSGSGPYFSQSGGGAAAFSPNTANSFGGGVRPAT